jgi:hypothetical protein
MLAQRVELLNVRYWPKADIAALSKWKTIGRAGTGFASGAGLHPRQISRKELVKKKPPLEVRGWRN